MRLHADALSPLSRFAAIGALAAVLVAAAGAQTLHLIDPDTDTLYTVNPATGAATAVGTTLPGQNGVGLAWDGVWLYTIVNGSPPSLYRVNPTTGAATLVSTLGGGGFEELVWDPFTHRFYGINTGDQLYAFDLSGATTLVGTTPSVQNIAALAIDAAGNLWCIDAAPTGQLGRLDKSTAAYTAGPVTNVPLVMGMSFHPSSGVLYATSGSTDSLYTINTATGAGTLIGAHGGNPAVIFVRGMVWTASPPAFDKVMLTEVSWGDPDGCELTNFSASAVDLTGWQVLWHDGTLRTSSALNVMIASGESIVVREAGTAIIAEAPAGTQILTSLPTISTTSAAHNVALRDAVGAIVDEVRVSSTTGTSTVPPLGGLFRGLAVRSSLSGTSGAVGVERIWGLDSDGGTDWTEQPNRSFGLESRSSGPRGADPVPVPAVRINETDDSPDYVELYNAGSASVNVTGWYFLMSAGQEQAHVRISPFPASTVLGPGAFVVIGDSTAVPAELPAGGAYVNVGAAVLGSQNIPWITDEYDCALYDVHGRLVDLMRTTLETGIVVHNHPRAPAGPLDFTGAAGRAGGGGADAIGRSATGADTGTGADFRPVFVRTLGSANTGFAAGPGLGSVLDVRIHEGRGDGLTILWNAGPAAAGGRYSFFTSAGHLNGLGPFLGLGPEALQNWLLILGVPPFSGFLDAQGSARLDLPPVSLPPGADADCLFIVESPPGQLVAHTLVCEFDS